MTKKTEKIFGWILLSSGAIVNFFDLNLQISNEFLYGVILTGIGILLIKD